MKLPAKLKLGGLGTTLAAVALAILTGSILLTVSGYSPMAAWSRLLQGALGINMDWHISAGLGSLIDRPVRLGNSINESVPLIIVGLALAIPFKCGLFNLGGTGQILMGGLGAALVGMFVPPMHSVVFIPLALGAGAALGALWAFLPGILKSIRCMDEIITTIMLNYVAFWFISYLVGGPLCDKSGTYGGFPWTPEMPAYSLLPVVWPAGRVHVGILFAVISVVLVHFLMKHSILGFRMRVAGASPEAADFNGYPVTRLQVVSMLFSGLLSGIAGACLLLGIQRRLTDSLDAGYGFDAIAVLLMGRGNPVGILAAGLFWGCFRTGSEAMEVSENIPKALCSVIQALMLMFLMIFQGGMLSSFLQKRKTFGKVSSNER